MKGKYVGFGVATCVCAFVMIGFIPFIVSYVSLKNDARQLEQSIRDIPEYSGFHCYPVMRKFKGVIVEGGPISNEQLAGLRTLVQEQPIDQAKIITTVEGQFIEEVVAGQSFTSK